MNGMKERQGLGVCVCAVLVSWACFSCWVLDVSRASGGTVTAVQVTEDLMRVQQLQKKKSMLISQLEREEIEHKKTGARPQKSYEWFGPKVDAIAHLKVEVWPQ